jgi:hypothetical protein
MSKNAPPTIPQDVQGATVTPQPTELTLTIIRQYARNNHALIQLSIADNMINLS